MDCFECSNCNTECTDISKKKLPLITSIFLNLTQRCNLKCKYCFVHQNSVDMDYKTAKDITDFVIRNAEEENRIPSINFFGGEPMLKYDEIIVPLTNYIRNEYKKPFQLSITTNGTLLNKERIKFLKNNNISFMVSIDGNKKTQDLNRPFHDGRSSFDNLEKRKIIDRYLECHPDGVFRMTLDHDNCNELLDNCKFAYSKGFRSIFYIVNISANWSDKEKHELKTAFKQVSDWYIELLREGSNLRINPILDGFKNIKRIDNFNKQERFRDITDRPAYGKCGLGASVSAAIGPNGDIYSCQEMVGNRDTGDKFIIGNIYDGVIDKKRWDIIDLLKVDKIHCNNIELCKECKMYNICDGGCTINNYFSTGDINVPSEIICLYYQYCLEEAIYIMNILSKEKNNIFKELFKSS